MLRKISEKNEVNKVQTYESCTCAMSKNVVSLDNVLVIFSALLHLVNMSKAEPVVQKNVEVPIDNLINLRFQLTLVMVRKLLLRLKISKPRLLLLSKLRKVRRRKYKVVTRLSLLMLSSR